LSLLVGNCKVREADSLLYVNRPTDLRLEKLLLGPDFYPFPYNPVAYFYDKRLHDLVGPYDVSDDYSMDLDFLLRAVRVANVVYVDETWGNYLIHPEAKTVRDRKQGSQVGRVNKILRRHRRLLSRRRRSALYFELALRRTYWRFGAARAALRSES
jgi:hypothetical protein